MVRLLLSLLLIVQLLLGQLLQFHCHLHAGPAPGHAGATFPHIHLCHLASPAPEAPAEAPDHHDSDVLPVPDLGLGKTSDQLTAVCLSVGFDLMLPSVRRLSSVVGSHDPALPVDPLLPGRYSGPLYLQIGLLLI